VHLEPLEEVGPDLPAVIFLRLMGNRLYVGNLSFNTTRDRLEQAFSCAGHVQDVALVSDRETGQPRGFAFVTMYTPHEAQAAIMMLDGSALDGRQIRVNEAQERHGRGGEDGSDGGRGGRSRGGR